ncbi:indole-3-glycerol phosphate synthase TrpC [Nonlabens sp. SCSIO 43208]|uniref:indole-3-glycerol phosphate synthase TrpC n=1 Tax=Nonlabens sp. SCSIO 43208 TaxID=2793009 RepID=UPI003D6B90FF
MSDILEKITIQTTKDVVQRRSLKSIQDLREMPLCSRKTLSLHESIKKGSGIIAEHKRQSPSKGSFNCPASLEEVVLGYEKAGASAISCLTDTPFFGGSLQDLEQARKLINIPILRKDFIVDMYQIHEAKAYGADAILLIAACLSNEQLTTLANEALNLELEILFEVHNLTELENIKKVTENLDPEKFIIGVNNRDLKRFKTDIQNSIDLLPHFPENVIAISESGISNPATVKKLQSIGFKGFLIGENFMKTDQPGISCSTFIKEITV